MKKNICIYAITGAIGIAIGGIISKLKSKGNHEEVEEIQEETEESE